jgi:bifunctional non-homologous end joining protein LigD
VIPIAEPVLPQLSRELPLGRVWRYELKLDGFRGMLYVDRGTAGFRSKTKRPMPRFDDLAARVAAELDVRDAVLDGEIVVMGARGPEFNALLFNRGVPQFAAFDLVWLDGRDLRFWPQEKRKAALQRLVHGCTWISLIESHSDAQLFEIVSELDLEGVVAKRRDEAYTPTTRWIKVKNRNYSQAIGRWRFFEGRRRPVRPAA